MALVSEIITDFNQFMDDTSDLSTSEEIRLAEKHSQRIANLIPWEILKQSYASSGAVSSTTDALPERFSHVLANDNYSETNEYGSEPVVYIGSQHSPWRVVSWSDRRNYRDRKGYAYIDVANSNMVFSEAPNDTIEYDYHQYPVTLTDISDTIWIPDRFAPILYHSMCADSFVIQQSEKAKSYRDEHLAGYNMYLNDMKSWNYNLVQLT